MRLSVIVLMRMKLDNIVLNMLGIDVWMLRWELFVSVSSMVGLGVVMLMNVMRVNRRRVLGMG